MSSLPAIPTGAEVGDRIAQAIRRHGTPMADRVIGPMLRVSPLFFAYAVLGGPPMAPFSGRLLFSPAHLEWERIITQSKRYVISAGRGTGKSFVTTFVQVLWQCATQPDRSQYIFSGTEFGAQRMLEEIRLEIEKNPKLQWLFPSSKSRKWTATQLRTSNGYMVTAKGMLTRVRGAHPSRITVDDGLSDEDGWSQAKRKKTIEYFYSTITNMILPGGQIGVVGCVTGDTLINSAELGLIEIQKFAPNEPSDPRRRRGQIVAFKHPVEGKGGARYTSHFWCNGYSSNIICTLKNGLELTASRRHPVWCMSKQTGAGRWKKMSELEKGDFVAIKTGAKSFGPPIVLLPVHKEQISEEHKAGGRMKNMMLLPSVVTPDLGYLIGLWVAEGSRCPKGKVSISNTEPHIREWLYNKPFGMPFRPGTTNETRHQMRVQCMHFYRVLTFLGIASFEKAPKKSIPKKLMSAPRDIIVGFLQGLYDGDGCAQPKTNHVILSTTSEVLAKQVQAVLLNLGINSYRWVQKKLSKQTKKAIAKHLLWTVRCGGEDAERFMREVGFRLPRKRDSFGKMRKSWSNRLIPHQWVVIDEMVREWGMRKVEGRAGRSTNAKKKTEDVLLEKIQRAAGLNFSELRKNGKSGARADSLRRTIEAFGMLADPCDASLIAQKTLADNFVWMPVTGLKKAEGATYDFVVPKDHTFLANGIVSHNTPFHSEDLLANLHKNPAYVSGKFPSLNDKRQSTWPEVYPTDALLAIEKEIGSVRFARERLCQPISDDSSLFPKSLFFQEDVMQPTVCLGQPLSYWKQAGVHRIFIAVDFAFSTNIGSDFVVLWVMGLDDHDNRWIIDIYRDKGVPYGTQKQMIVTYGRRYAPETIYLEANQAQQIVADELIQQTDLPIRKYYTTAEKHSLSKGIPSMRVLLENRKYRIPRGDQRSVELTDIFINECNNFTFLNGKVQSVGGHDDCVSAAHICEQAIKSGGFTFRMGDQGESVKPVALPATAAEVPAASQTTIIQDALSGMVPTSTPAPARIVMRNGVPVRADD